MPIANRGCLYFGGSVYDPGPGKNTTSFDDGGIRLSLPNTYVAAFKSVGAWSGEYWAGLGDLN